LFLQFSLPACLLSSPSLPESPMRGWRSYPNNWTWSPRRGEAAHPLCTSYRQPGKSFVCTTLCRDKLKAELEELRASMTNGLALSGGDDTAKVSPFLMRKSRATVAASRHSFAAPAVPSPLTNGHPEDVPVKPQRPSKAVITDRLATVAPPTGSRPRSRTTTLFQSLLHS
jgi:hypothetical protein